MTPTIPPRFEPRAGIAGIDCGHGDALLLLHGVGLRAEAWAAQIARFSSTHRVIAIDTPGHGGSTALQGRPSLPDFVARIAAFLDEADCGPVNVAGHSLGALLAVGLTLEHPHHVQRVAALNAVHQRDPQARAAVTGRAEAMLAGSVDHSAPLRRWFDAQASGAERLAREQTAAWLSMAEPSGYAAAYHAFAHGDDVYAGRLGEIACPALFLTGELDPNSTPAMSAAMAAATHRGRAVVLPGQRHMANMVAPQAVGDVISEWLAEPLESLRAAAS